MLCVVNSSRSIPTLWLAAALLCLAAAVTPATAQDSWSAKRAAARALRTQLVAEAHADAANRADHAAKAISALLDRVASGQVTARFEDLAQLIAGLGRLDASRLGKLPKRLTALTPAQAPDTLDDPAPWDAALQQVRDAVTDRPYTLLKRAANAGEVGLAVELMWEVLWFNPDHAKIRKGLGMGRLPAKLEAKAALDRTRARDAFKGNRIRYERFDPDRLWYRAFDAARLKEGLVWSPQLGWANPAYPDRYDRGGVFDLQQRKWVTLQSANAYHSRPERAWEVRTEHLIIRGTADLAVLADAATQLNAFRREIFGLYAGFFLASDEHDVLRLALGLADTKPLEVWILRDHAQYLQVSGAPAWSGGVYIPSQGVCYFYGRVNPTMFHEFTHQILGVFAGRNSAPAWLVEGIAVHTETAAFKQGRVAIRGARPSHKFSVPELMKLKTNRAWHAWHGSGDNPSAYADAGSLVTFCMNADDARHRADTLDFIRDSYLGRTRGREIWDYLGVEQNTFVRDYERWRR